jgi:hypothetical protein
MIEIVAGIFLKILARGFVSPGWGIADMNWLRKMSRLRFSNGKGYLILIKIISDKKNKNDEVNV